MCGNVDMEGVIDQGHGEANGGSQLVLKSPKSNSPGPNHDSPTYVEGDSVPLTPPASVEVPSSEEHDRTSSHSHTPDTGETPDAETPDANAAQHNHVESDEELYSDAQEPTTTSPLRPKDNADTTEETTDDPLPHDHSSRENGSRTPPNVGKVEGTEEKSENSSDPSQVVIREDLTRPSPPSPLSVAETDHEEAVTPSPTPSPKEGSGDGDGGPPGGEIPAVTQARASSGRANEDSTTDVRTGNDTMEKSDSQTSFVNEYALGDTESPTYATDRSLEQFSEILLDSDPSPSDSEAAPTAEELEAASPKKKGGKRVRFADDLTGKPKGMAWKMII